MRIGALELVVCQALSIASFLELDVVSIKESMHGLLLSIIGWSHGTEVSNFLIL